MQARTASKGSSAASARYFGKIDARLPASIRKQEYLRIRSFQEPLHHSYFLNIN